MWTFKFQSTFENKAELKEELQNLLIQIDSTWPIVIPSGKLKQEYFDWIKDKINQSWLKLNSGNRSQSIEKS